MRLLKKGSQGTDVTELQVQLNILGYYNEKMIDLLNNIS